MRKLIIAILCIAAISCGESENKEEKNQQPERKTKSTSEDIEKTGYKEEISGIVKLQLDNEEFVIEEFRKNKTEISFLENQLTMRLTHTDDNQYVMITFSGPDIYASKPVTFYPASNKDAQNKVNLIFIGFRNKADIYDQLTLKTGELVLSELDENSLDVEISFKGELGKQTDIKNENLKPAEGRIEMTFDNAIDMRK